MRAHMVVRGAAVISLAGGMSAAGFVVAYKTASGMTSKRHSDWTQRAADRPVNREEGSRSSDHRRKHDVAGINWRNDRDDDGDDRKKNFRDVFDRDFFRKLKHLLAKFKKHHKHKKHCKIVSPSCPFPPGPPFDPPGPPFDPPGPPFDPPGPPFDPPGPPFDHHDHDHDHHDHDHHHDRDRDHDDQDRDHDHGRRHRWHRR